ncbi:hypothetical protein EXIGLDRAFT_733269 [Exidia glandulosa HHB12029]|uniref:Uncharacterized protein n=1 Tax=Exidia glandulosa HHB12029 TaxID=1314781 RepID=A0A165BCE3_EXIGL|nr:hypothetical protein EXIGLDRAFT_733269 [Exidia glandulosa HHB12029]
MLTTYFDIACPAAYFSSLTAGDDIPPDLEYLDAAAGLLILQLDFADLYFDNTMSDDTMYDVCDGFLDAAGRRFFHKYANYLPEPYPPGSGGHSCIGAIYAAQRSGYQVFLAIDNYTSPFSRVPGIRWESVVCAHIMLPILKLVAKGHIFRGVMVGTDLGGGYRPFEFSDKFKALTIDLTDASELATACGFTADEVHLLGDYAGIDNLLEDVRAATQQAESPSSTSDSNVQIFCTREVLELARQRLAGRTSQLVTVNAININVAGIELDNEDFDEAWLEDEPETFANISTKYDTSWMLEFMDVRDDQSLEL